MVRAIARMQRRRAEILGDEQDPATQPDPEPIIEASEAETWIPLHQAFSDEVIDFVTEVFEIDAQLEGLQPIDWKKWGDG